MGREHESYESVPGSTSALSMGLLGSLSLGLGAAKAALALAPVALPGRVEELANGLDRIGFSAGAMSLCGLALFGMGRCLSAIGRSHRRLRARLDEQNDLEQRFEELENRVQHAHVSVLGSERALQETLAQNQTLVDRRLESSRAQLEQVGGAVEGLRRELGQPLQSLPALEHRLAQIEAQLAELGQELGHRISDLGSQLSNEVVRASETIADWMAREEARQPEPTAGIEVGESRGMDSIEIQPEGLDELPAALPTAFEAHTEAPKDSHIGYLDGLGVEMGENWLDSMAEPEAISPERHEPRAGFASAELIKPNEAAALAQTGFHRVQSLGFLDEIEEPSHPELAGVEEPSLALPDLDTLRAALPGPRQQVPQSKRSAERSA